ncbi:MAG: hypothetical protein OQK03_01760, partial [Colwellia sp.]|nr:hypothetical protein [Colwellia sp.]
YAGIYLFKKVGDKVTKGEVLYKIYACFKSDFEFATQFANNSNAYRIDKSSTTYGDNYLL